MGDFVADKNQVHMAEMLRFVADRMGESPISNNGIDTSLQGKTTAGVEASALFAGFSIDSVDGVFPRFKTYNELYNMMFSNGSADSEDPPSGILASGDFDKIISYNKYWSNEYKTVSDSMLPDDKTRGVVNNIDKSMNNNNAMRPIANRGPIWIVGDGQNQNGKFTGQEKVGPLDLYYDENALMWRATQEFPIYGKVMGSSNNNPYTVEVCGVNVSASGDAEFVKSTTISSKKLILENVYNLSEEIGGNSPTLSSGDIVSINLDQINGTLVCTNSTTSIKFGTVESPPLNGLALVTLQKVNDDGTKESLNISFSGVIPE